MMENPMCSNCPQGKKEIALHNLWLEPIAARRFYAKLDAIAAFLAYQAERELSLILLSLDGYRNSSAPGLEEVIERKEREGERVKLILEGLRG